jgi:hypothetical protein
MKYLVVFLISNIYLIEFDFMEGADWYVMQFGSSVSMLMLFYIIFSKTPPSKINERSLLALFMYYQTYGILSYLPLVLNKTYSLYPIYGLVLIFVIRAYNVSKRNYNKHSDPIIKNNIYLCFERPTKTRGVFTSLLGSPFCSVSIYYRGFLYGFKWTLPKYMKRHVSQKNLLDKYLVVDTGKDNDELNQMLQNMIGQQASFCRTRIKCVWAIRDFLNALGPEYKPIFIEYLPSLFAKKTIGLKNG